MAHYPAFVGGSYESIAVTADCQRTVNLYPEAVESGSGKVKVILRSTPGLEVWLDLEDGGPVRGLYECGGKVFAVSGSTLYQITNGAAPLGTVDYPSGSSAMYSAIAAQASLAYSAGAFPTYPYGTADQWNALYGQVTQHVPPMPETYGFGTGTYGRYQQVVQADWWAAFNATGPVFTARGVVGNDYQPIIWTDNGSQLMLISAGRAWILDMYDTAATATMVTLPDIASGTDLVVDAANDRRVSSASYAADPDVPGFNTDDALRWITISAGTGWTAGQYQIVQVNDDMSVVLDRSPAAVGTTGGTWSIPSPNWFISCGFIRGFFILVDGNSQLFRINQRAYDGHTWDPLDFGAAENSPDNLNAMKIDHGDVWLFGLKSIEVWEYTGAADFPLERNSGANIEIGLAAPYSVCSCDNAVYFLGGDSIRGGRIAWRAQGYQPQRISTHAIEQAWDRYETIEDAISYSYEDEGHAFWVLSFPSADATWVYDAKTGFWHERSRWDPDVERLTRYRGRCHCYAFRKHLVGDRISSKIFSSDNTVYDEDEEDVYRIRIAPHLSDEQMVLGYYRFQLDLDVGETSMADAQFDLTWSNDGGRTWTSPHTRSLGDAGNYKARLVWNRLGSGRDRVFQVQSTAAMKHAWTDAYLTIAKGIS